MLTVIDDGVCLGNPVFVTEVDVRWGDLDADGYVNNTRILSFVEEARMQWVTRLRGVKFTPALMPVVASLACAYRIPIGYPAKLTISIRCTRLGTSSMDLSFLIQEHCSASKGSVYAEVSIVWVWVDTATGRPHSLPQAVRDAVDQQEG